MGRAEFFEPFTFTLPFEEEIHKARLKFYCSKKKKEQSKEEFKLSLLLDMERIGEIRTDLVLISKSLNIRFFVKDNNIKKQLKIIIRKYKSS